MSYLLKQLTKINEAQKTWEFLGFTQKDIESMGKFSQHVAMCTQWNPLNVTTYLQQIVLKDRVDAEDIKLLCQWLTSMGHNAQAAALAAAWLSCNSVKNTFTALVFYFTLDLSAT